MIVRKQSWQIDMASAIEAAGAAPFAWGSNDCSLFVCDVILAMTGVDLAADFRGKYATRDEAAALIGFATDGGGLEDLVEQLCGANAMPEVEVNFAWRGDVALHDTADGPCLGVIDREGGVYLTEKHGLRFLPRGDIRRTWRV
jgi:hypothetical protein